MQNFACPSTLFVEFFAPFCQTRYFGDVETRWNRPGRNRERSDSQSGDVFVFNHGVNFLGASQYLEAGDEYDKMVWFVLSNCAEVLPYIEKCKEELNQEESNIHIDKRVAKGFAKWFKNHIGKLHEEKKVSDDLFALACLPDKRVRVYSACIADGVWYHTVDREEKRKTHNSGIVTEGSHDGEIIDFYGQLRSIVELQYNSSRGIHRSVVLFRCDWFELGSKKKIDSFVKYDGHFKSINTARCWYKSDPFILTTQATMVFYLPDTLFHEKWRVVQNFQHRHLWSVAETEVEKGPGDGELTYQDDDSTEVPLQADDDSMEVPVQSRVRRDRERVIVGAATVEGIKKRRKVVADGHESEDEEDRTDHTMLQYCSDDEENRSGHRVPWFRIDDDE